MSVYQQTLKLDEVMSFGKHLGTPIVTVIQNDPGCLCWLREQRWGADKFPASADMEPAIHELLDAYLDSPAGKKQVSKQRFRKAGTQVKPTPELEITFPDVPDVEPKRELEAWGAW